MRYVLISLVLPRNAFADLIFLDGGGVTHRTTETSWFLFRSYRK